MPYEISINNQKKYTETTSEALNYAHNQVYLSEESRLELELNLDLFGNCNAMYGYSHVFIKRVPHDHTPLLYRIRLWFKCLTTNSYARSSK